MSYDIFICNWRRLEAQFVVPNNPKADFSKIDHQQTKKRRQDGILSLKAGRYEEVTRS